MAASDSERQLMESAERTARPIEALAVIKSKTDNKHGWLAAGQAMASVLLQAEALGLPLTCLNQAVRTRNARAELLTGLGRRGVPQVVLGLGSWTPNPTVRSDRRQLQNRLEQHAR